MIEPGTTGVAGSGTSPASGGARPVGLAGRTWLAPLLATLVLLPGLGAIDLWAPDEPRYAQIAEELRSFEHGAGGLVLLHLNGEIYTQKPPLYYWLAALAGVPQGRVSEIAARLPSALAGIGCVWLVQRFGASLCAAPGAGPLSALVLLTILRFAHQARRAQLDVLLTLLELASLWAGWQLTRPGGPERGSRRGWLALLHGGVGLAMLTKGPVGALPYLVLLVQLAWDRRLAALRPLFPAWGLALALAPAGLWLLGAVALAPPGFFAEAVVDNVWSRFATGTAHVRPIYYYAYQLPLDLLPWTPLVAWAVVQAVRCARTDAAPSAAGRRGAARWLLAWLGTFVVFFSLSSGKRGLYLLPAFPAAALLCGTLLAERLEAGRGRPPPAAERRWLRAVGRRIRAERPRHREETGSNAVEAYGLVLVVLLGLLGTGIALPGWGPPGTERFARFGAALAAIATLHVAVGAWLRRRRAPAGHLLVVLFASLCALQVATFALLFPTLDADKSPRPVARAVASLTTTHARVGVYRHSALTGGIEYYSGRRAVALETPDDLRRFAASGHTVVVAHAHGAEEVIEVTGGRRRAALRHGRRGLVVIEARPSDRERRAPGDPAAVRAVPDRARTGAATRPGALSRSGGFG